MTASVEGALLSRDAEMEVGRQLERLDNVRRLEGIIDYYRLNGARSGEIALAIVEFVKRGEEGVTVI